jgi:hypothetical protein
LDDTAISKRNTEEAKLGDAGEIYRNYREIQGKFRKITE